MVNNIRYASIRNFDISNGEGVGVALFVQGCHFHCYNCFNTNTWDFNGGKEWTQDTENKLIELASRPYIKRLSILGGEPLADENLDGVLHLVDRFRLSFPNKSIWLYTGYELSLETEYIPVDDFWNEEDEEYRFYLGVKVPVTTHIGKRQALCAVRFLPALSEIPMLPP